MNKTKFRDRGVSCSALQADQLIEEARFLFKQDDDYPKIAWREFSFGSMRGQYREIGCRQLDLLSLINEVAHNGHFQRLLKYAMRKYRVVRILYPHDRLKGYLLRLGFRPLGDHVQWEK